MATNKMKTAIGYIRVSTREQAEKGISLETQENKIKAYAELKDLNLIEVVKDQGRSGKNLQRKGIEALINRVQKKEVDAVVVYRLDRLTRRTKDLLFLVEDVFKKSDTAFYSLNENIDTTTATGKFFLTMMGAMAQMERDLISERTSDALQELKRQGRRLGSPNFVPYGFKMTKRKKQKQSDLQIDTKRIIEVAKMYALRHENKNKKKNTFESIGQKFGLSKSSVHYILNNPIYEELGVV